MPHVQQVTKTKYQLQLLLAPVFFVVMQAKVAIIPAILAIFGWPFSLAVSPEVEEAFSLDSEEESYQRQYVISVANKAEDCYYIPDVKVNQAINFHYVVRNRIAFIKHVLQAGVVSLLSLPTTTVSLCY